MTVPQQRSQQQPWPSTVAQQRPAPQAPPLPVAPGRSAVAVLRVVTYVLTSIASLLFIILVVYGVVKVNQFRDALSTSPFGAGYSSSSSYETSPNAGTRPAICDTDPTNPVCYGG